MNDYTQTKTITFDTPTTTTKRNGSRIKTEKSVGTTKERKKRVVTQTSRWTLQEDDYTPLSQMEILYTLQTDTKIDIHSPLYEKTRLLRSQLNGKIQGYKSQDIQKQKWNPEKFIDFLFVVQKLIDCGLNCFYCKEPMWLWYKHIREPKQWSVDRIDNDFGHNRDNIELACLSCNIRRRCMYHDRFRFTKQLNLVKLDHTSEPTPILNITHDNVSDSK